MWRKEPIDVLRGPLRRFLQAEVNAGLLLLAAAGVAMIWANSPWNASYFALWEHELALRFDDHVLAHDLRAWINDGLMAMFFFVVGLELKRELIGGRLSMVSTAALPIAAAIGGMVFPALIYLTVVGWEGPATSGWGIPMATDIAFAVGVLVLLGDRVSTGLKVFLTTLAIVDDLGAVLVIAFFYTSDISLANLMIGFGFLAVLMGGQLAGCAQSGILWPGGDRRPLAGLPAQWRACHGGRCPGGRDDPRGVQGGPVRVPGTDAAVHRGVRAFGPGG